MLQYFNKQFVRMIDFHQMMLIIQQIIKVVCVVLTVLRMLHWY